MWLHAHPPAISVHAGERPLASALARAQARDGEPVTTLRHGTIRVGDELDRRVLALLDGTRDRAALRAQLDGVAGLDGDALAERLEAILDRIARTAPADRVAHAPMRSAPRSGLQLQAANLEERTMPRVKLQISMSLDGYIAGPNQGEEHPLGEGGEQLHEWAVALQAWREPHGEEGGEVNASSPVMKEMQANVGAVVMGRNMFGPGRGPWEEHPWNGWWGDDPPFHAPVYVVTHHEREPLEMQGGTTFHFVTDGVETAIARAKEAAGEKDVSIGGGAKVVQQHAQGRARRRADAERRADLPGRRRTPARRPRRRGSALEVHARHRAPARHAPHVSRRARLRDEGDRSVT